MTPATKRKYYENVCLCIFQSQPVRRQRTITSSVSNTRSKLYEQQDALFGQSLVFVSRWKLARIVAWGVGLILFFVVVVG